MKGSGPLFVCSAVLAVGLLEFATGNPGFDCWEPCFATSEDLDEPDEQLDVLATEFPDLFQLGEKLKTLRLMKGVNGTAFLFDMTVPFVSERELAVNKKSLQFQKDLAILFTFMAPNLRDYNPFYASLFDAKTGWY